MEKRHSNKALRESASGRPQILEFTPHMKQRANSAVIQLHKPSPIHLLNDNKPIEQEKQQSPSESPTSSISAQDYIRQNQENPLIVLAESIKRYKKEQAKAGVSNQTVDPDHELTSLTFNANFVIWHFKIKQSLHGLLLALELKLRKAFIQQQNLPLRERLARSLKKRLLQTALEMEAASARTMEKRIESDLELVRSNTNKSRYNKKSRDSSTPKYGVSPGSARREGFQSAARRAQNLVRMQTDNSPINNSPYNLQTPVRSYSLVEEQPLYTSLARPQESSAPQFSEIYNSAEQASEAYKKISIPTKTLPQITLQKASDTPKRESHTYNGLKLQKQSQIIFQNTMKSIEAEQTLRSPDQIQKPSFIRQTLQKFSPVGRRAKMIEEKKRIEKLSSDSFTSDLTDESNEQLGKFVPQSLGALLNQSVDKIDNPSEDQSEQGESIRENSKSKENNSKQDNFDDMSDDSQEAKEQRVPCLIYPEDTSKRIWDFCIGILIIVMCITIPGHLALYFDEQDPFGLTVFNRVMDALFAIDIVLTFNTAIQSGHNQIVTKKSEIACRYLKSWFWVDLIATLPLDLLGDLLHNPIENIGIVFKFVRIFKIIRLLRLIKLIKIFKDRKRLILFQASSRMNHGMRRLIISSLSFLLLCHIIACIWILQAKLMLEGKYNWIHSFGYSDFTKFQLYTVSYYYTVTTITTVGYGDISATGTLERIFAIILMMGGVFAFSFATGTLSSILLSFDEKSAQMTQKLNVLQKLVKRYQIRHEISERIQASITFCVQNSTDEFAEFIDQLEPRLRQKVARQMYKVTQKKIKFFRTKTDKNFITWVCPLLKLVMLIQGMPIHREQDEIQEIYFLEEGEAAYVLPRYNNAPYVIIEPGASFGINLYFLC